MKNFNLRPIKWARSAIYIAIAYGIILMFSYRDYHAINDILDRVERIVKAWKE